MVQVDPCKEWLTSVKGFDSQDADAIINELRGVEHQRLQEYSENRTKFAQMLDEQKDLKERHAATTEEANRNYIFKSEDKSHGKNLLKLLVGVIGLKRNTIHSIGTMQGARIKERVGRIFAGMQITGKEFRALMNDQAFSKDFFKELHPWTTTSKTNNTYAYRLATLIHKEKFAQVLEARNYGSPIMWRDDHITVNWHNHLVMQQMGYSKWKSFILPLLDHEKTFGGMLNVDDQLKKSFKALTRFSDEYDYSKAREGGNLADILAESRELHFKDSDAWITYNKELGYADPLHAVFHNMEIMDNRLELLKQLGPDPNNAFAKLLQESNEQGLNPFLKNQILSSYKQISGQSFIVGKPGMAKITNAILSLHMISKLGKATLSSFNDIAHSALTLNYHGMGMLESYKKLFQSALRKVDPAERQLVLRYLGSGFDGVLGSAASRFGIHDTFPGLMHKFVDKYFHYTGLNAWTDWWRESFSRVASMYMADNLKFTYKKLPSQYQRLLEAYNISPKQWNKLREIGPYSAHDLIKSNPGEKIAASSKDLFITPDWVRQHRTRVGDSIDDMADKLGGLFFYEARTAVPEIGAGERATMVRTWQRGTLLSSVAQLFFQFRTVQMVTAMRQWPRMYQMGLPSLLHLTPMIGLGYASITAKDLFAGKEPRDPTDPDTALMALEQSGIAGYFGDGIVAAFSDHARAYDETMGGPSYTAGKDLVEIVDDIYNDREYASDIWTWVQRNTLPLNIFYMQYAYNAALNWQIQDYLNPGYASRSEAWADFQGNGYIDAMKPTNYVSHGGLWGVGD